MAGKVVLAAPQAEGANSIDITEDLLQRMAKLTGKVTELATQVDEVSPAMETILQIRDQLVTLEDKTITIVNQFQEQIFNKEDQADQIILNLNEEVKRIETHISDLLDLSENFESIADEIKELLALKEQVAKLEDYVGNVSDTTSTVVSDTNIPVDDREEGKLYMIKNSEDGDNIYLALQDHTGKNYNLITNATAVKYEGASKSTLFTADTNLEQVLDRIDDLLSEKVKMLTFYAAATANYSGSAAPYTQTVSVPGILATDEPLAGLIVDSNAATALNQEKAFGNVSRIETANNSVTLYCNKKKPEVPLNIRLVVFRTV